MAKYNRDLMGGVTYRARMRAANDRSAWSMSDIIISVLWVIVVACTPIVLITDKVVSSLV